MDSYNSLNGLTKEFNNNNLTCLKASRWLASRVKQRFLQCKHRIELNYIQHRVEWNGALNIKILVSMHYGALNNNSNLPKGIVSSSLRRNNTNNPPTQNQQISKSTVYSCCTIKYSTRNGALTSMYCVIVIIQWLCGTVYEVSTIRVLIYMLVNTVYITYCYMCT